MEVNDCHLQFFDSLGNLIYEFDLETIIALNNGNGILIKDDLTTLTIDNNIVVDNLTMTIAELITYIQEQRVLCDCCASAPAASVTSATWGYDALGVLFYVKQKSDGTIVYESPIGTVTAPTGSVEAFRSVAQASSLNVIETNSAGAIPPCFAWTIINTGGGALTLNGVVLSASAFGSSNQISMESKTLPHIGLYLFAPTFTYDATSTTITIIYQS